MYAQFAEYPRKFAHSFIDYSFPRTGSIALASACVGWYALRYIETYAPGKLADGTAATAVAWLGGIVPEKVCSIIGYVVAPVWVPDVTKQFAPHIAVGAGLATSAALNLIAQVFFGIKAKKDAEHPLEKKLIELGLMNPKTKKFIEPTLAPLISDPQNTEPVIPREKTGEIPNCPVEEVPNPLVEIPKKMPFLSISPLMMDIPPLAALPALATTTKEISGKETSVKENEDLKFLLGSDADEDLIARQRCCWRICC